MRTFSLLFVFFAFICSHGWACDLHALFGPGFPGDRYAEGFGLSLSEQYTHFGTLSLDGNEIDNPTNQYLNSSATNLFVHYNFTERIGIHANVPLAYKSFQRPVEQQLEQGSESGIGDVTVLAVFTPYQSREQLFHTAWRWYGGVKLPTGSTDFLGEEAHEHGHEEEPGEAHEHEEISGVHGHDISIGTGSYDAIAGTEFVAQWAKFFLVAHLQYLIRTEGDFNYQYANDLIWHVGPSYSLVSRPEWSFALQASLSGETKDLDTLAGEELTDTGLTAVYAGPVALLQWSRRANAELGVTFPLSVDNTGLQTVPSYRIRAGITWQIW